MHLAQPTGLARVPSHQSLSFALRNQTGRANQGRWAAVPSKCGRRHRPFVLVSCRFHPEIGARLVTRSHYGHAMPLVYPGEPSMGAFGPLSAAPPNPEMGVRPHAQVDLTLGREPAKCMILTHPPLTAVISGK